MSTRPPARRQARLSWTPPDYSVDAAGKIVGLANEAHPNNWGRWGELDEVGTANFIRPEHVVDAARLIESGRVISCALALGAETPVHPTRHPTMHLFRHSGADTIVRGRGMEDDRRFQGTDDYLVMPLQGSTQWDGLAHVGSGDALYNGFWMGTVDAGGGAKRCSIELMADRLVGRGVLVDVAHHRGVERLTGGTHITVEELDACLTAQGVQLTSGDMLVVRTGHLPYFYSLDDKTAFWDGGAPGLGEDFAGWANDRQLAGVAMDTMALEVEPWPTRNPYPLHVRLIRDLGMSVGELWWLEELSEACAADGRYAFFLSAAPVPVANGVGSVVNPLAIK